MLVKLIINKGWLPPSFLFDRNITATVNTTLIIPFICDRDIKKVALHFLINHNFYIVDLPGYGFAKVSQNTRSTWEKMIAGYLQQRTNLVTVFVLIDSRHEPQNLDLAFLRKLGAWGIPFNVIFTKADKSTQREAAKHAKQFIEAMKKEWEFIPRSFITSAIKFLGRKEILAYIDEMNKDFKLEEIVVPEQG